MKLHLPTKLFAALMAVFAMNVSTTVGADVISINFGKNAIPAGATGDVGGVAAANWNNITGDNAAAVNGTHDLAGSSGTTYSAVLTLNTPQAPWGPNQNVDTVLNAMQSSYLDLSGGNSWTITLNLDHISADYTLYFNGDGDGSGKYTAIKVNDVAYRGGEGVDNDEAGKTEHWGVRQTSTTMDDNNTIELDDVGGNSVITNIASGNNSQRATISGMQVTLNDINEHTLGTGVTEASGLASSTGYLGITAAAGGSTLNLSNANLKGIQATANNLTVTGTGTVGRLWAKKDTVLTLSATLTANSGVEFGGLGTISIAANQSLGTLAGVGTLKIAGGAEVTVADFNYKGSFTVESGGTLILTEDLSGEEVATGDSGTIGRLFDSIAAGGTASLTTGVKMHTSAPSATHTLAGTLNINGFLELNSGNSHTWDIVSGGALTTQGDLIFKRNQLLKLSGGEVTSQGKLILGHEDSGNYPGHLLVESGELTVDGIYLRYGDGNDTVTVKDGVLEFTPDDETISVITRDNVNSSVVISGGTLKANTKSWVIDLGADGRDISLGGVALDIANGKSITLGGDISMSNAITHNSDGVLKFAEGTVITLVDSDTYTERSVVLTDYVGATDVGNGFESAQITVLKGTGLIEGSAAVNFQGVTATVDSDHRSIAFETNYSLYKLYTGTAVYSSILSTSAANGVSEGVIVRVAEGASLNVDSGDVKGIVSTPEAYDFTGSLTSIVRETTISNLSGTDNDAVVSIENGKTLTITDGTAPNVSFGLKANSSIVFGDGTTGSITVKNVRLGGADNGADNSDNWNRNVTIKEGTTLNAANFSDNWGMGTLRVDGVLNVSEQFKLWAGGAANDNNIVGNGVINTKNFESGNWGEYHLSVKEFNITGAATMGSTVKVTDSVLNLKGTTTFNGNLQVLADGIVNSSGVLTVNGGNMQLNGNLSGTVAVNGGTLDITKLQGLGAGTITVGGNGTLLTDILNQASGTTMTLSGKVNNFTKAGEGTIDISAAQLTGDVLMNYSGTVTGSAALANDATLVYGGTGTLMSITSLDTSLTGLNIDISRVTEADLADSIDLGISKNVITESFTLENLKSLLGIKVGSLSLDNVTNTVHYSATISDGAKALWDSNWGTDVLVEAPATVTEAVITDFNSDGKGLSEVGYLKDNRVAVKLVANSVGDVSGGPDTPKVVAGGAYDAPGNGGSELTIEDGVWINAVAGRYGAVVGGNMAGNWQGSGASKINTDSHIVINKAADASELFIRAIVGGNFGDMANADMANAAQFTGDTYVSIYTDTAQGSVTGGSITFHGGCSVLTGDTHVYVYTALASNGATVYRNALKAVVGGMMAADDNATNKHTLTGNSSVLIDLSGDTSTSDFVKILVGGNVGRGGNSVLDGSSSLTIKGNKAGNTAAKFTGVVVGGSYAQGGTSTIGSSTLDIDGGEFGAVVAGGVYQASASTSTIGDTDTTVKNATLKNWLAGGSFTNSGGSTATQGDVKLTLTDSSFSKVVVGGLFIGGPNSTGSVDDVTVTLDGVTLTEGIYGGAYHYANTGASTSTVGDVLITLTGDGEISGNIWAAGGSRYAQANMTVASTTVKVADTVEFAEGVTISGGFDLVAGSTPNATVTGDRTLEFTATQDRSGVSFKDFDVIKVTEAASTVTVGALTMTDAVTIGGAGTIKLGAASTLSGGVTVESALNLNGKSLTGAVTVAEDGALIAGATGSAVTGALTLGDGSALDVSAGSIALGSSGLTLGQGIVLTNITGELERGTHTLLTGVGSWNLTGSVHAGDVFASINGKSGDDIADYTLELVDGNLNLNVFFSKELTWAESNDIWADGAQFGATAEDIFVNGDKATFGALTANETVTVNGPITANTVSITAGEGKSYTFTAGTNGTISTGDLSIGAGSAIFGAGTLQVNDLSKVTIAKGGVLDVSAFVAEGQEASNLMTSLEIAQGDESGVGTIKLGNRWWVRKGDTLSYGVNLVADDALEFNSYGDGLALNISHGITVKSDGDSTDGRNGDLLLDNAVTATVQDGGSISVDGTIRLGHEGGNSWASHIVLEEGGMITAADITKTTAVGSTVNMTGGTLELTGTEGVASGITTTITGGTLKSGTNSWSISGATIGGASIVGSGTITLNGATLTATLDNSAGKLAVAGAINITSAGYVTTTTPSEYSEALNNGYVKTNTAFAVATTVDNLTVAAGTTWTVDGSAIGVTYDKGVVTLAGTDWGRKYYVTGADVTYSGIAKTNGEGEDLEVVVLNGSGLTLDAALDGVDIEVAKEGQSVVDIASGITLDSSSVTIADATHQLKLHGAGTYALANGVGTLGDGVVLGDSSSWTGTVKVSNIGSSSECINHLFNRLGNAASTVEVTGATGYFNTTGGVASKDAECTANLRLVNGESDSPAIIINNGNADASGSTQRYSVISGTVSGSGDIRFDCWSNNAGTDKCVNYKFTGEVSGWDGSFINAGKHNRTVHVIFEGDDVINASVVNDGNVAGCESKLTIGGASAVTMNGNVDVTNMVLDQTTTFTGSVAVSNSITNNGGMTLSNDLTLAGQLGGTGNVTGTNLALQGAANTAGDITLTGALTLGTDSVASTLTAGALDITGGITFNALAESQITAGSLAADLGLSISDALLLTQISQSATKSLTLMTVTDLGGHGILLNGGSEYDSADGQYRYTVDIVDGAVTITSAANGLKWNGSDIEGEGNSNVWSEGDSWLSDTAPESNNSVVFDGAGCSEVIISGSVAIENVTIDVDAANGATTGYEFVGTSSTDELHLSKNLSVNAGSLILGVNTVVDGRSEVVAGASLELIAGNLASQFGFDNAGELIITSGANQSLVSVAGGDLVNTGTITNAGMLQVGYGAPGAENTPNIINSGSIENIGNIGVDGDLNNTGSYVQTAGSLVVLGDVNNTTDGENPGDMDISGGTVAVTGAINNSADLTVSGDETTVSVGSLVNTDGTLNIESGSVTVGSEETPGTLDNSDGTIVLGGESTAGSLIVNGDLGNTGGSISVAGGSDLTVNGDVDNKAGGSISVTGGSSLVVSGDLDNTGGDLSLSDSSTTAAIGGDLIMTDGTAKGTLTVGEGTELTVGGDLAASNVDLAFGGNVTVGGDVEIGTLNNNGIFTANGSADTEVHIGTLTMTKNGTLSVGKETEDGLAGGHLDIGTLSGEGAVNVGKDGSLTINSATTFTGQLNNAGALTVIGTTTLDSAQSTSAEQTAGDITTKGLIVTAKAIGYNGGSYQLGDVKTDELTIDGISTTGTRLSMDSLDGSTGGKVKLVLSDIEDGTVTDGSYHLIELDEAMAGSIAEEFDLSNYGYNADGDYDRTLATVQSDYMQALLKANKYVTFSDVAPTDGVALLSGGTTDVYASITELSPELSVWNLNGTETMTEAGLTVLKDGKLVSDDILDNVQTVKVTGEQAIDLTGDITRVTLNNLTAAEGSATALTISGDGSADDSAAITTAADGFDGTLVLTKASADISGKVTTLQTGDDSAANLGLSDSAIEVTGTGVTLSGVVNNGSLNFGLGSDELGKEIIGGDVRLNGTAINVTQQDNSIVIDGVGAGVNTIADLGETYGSATVTLNGKGFDKYFSNARLEGGNVVADRNDSYVTDKLAPTSPNGAAGAELLDATLVYDNPQASREEMPDRAALLDAVDAGRVTDEELAAVAGASVATMGMALSGDVERQLRAIRNRTTSMGVNECVVNEGMPYFNAWVNAEGNRAELDKDGTLAGYTLDSWGGTVGFDVDFDPHFTAGLAITAMYGDLTASGPETKAEGDMDTYYVTLFARYAKSAWTHTFVGTIGLMDGSMDRTVSAGGRTYKTEGDTEGMSFGLMYEVGYVMPLDEDATACLQPIFNVMLRHAGVDSYTEKGGDAALDVDSQSVTTLTFGLGARLQAVVGESLYNRASIFEARALVKADVGDRSSEADVAFVGSSHTATVESAELGAVGVELGAGLTIPVGDDDGSIFIDGSVELRSGYTNVNGTVGYRINF